MPNAVPIAKTRFAQSVPAGACASVAMLVGKRVTGRENGLHDTEGPQPLRSARKTVVESKSCNGDFGDRGWGLEGPTAVVKRELFDGLVWTSTVSPDGVRVDIARLGFPARAPITGG
jgi:hypothetical protein